MLKPEGVANVLKTKLHAVDVKYEPAGDNGVKLYEYHVDFDEYKTLSLLRELTHAAERVTGVELLVNHIEPVLHMDTDQRIEARVRVVIRETVNRRELENRPLTEFSE